MMLSASPARSIAFRTLIPRFKIPVPWPTMTKRASGCFSKTSGADFDELKLTFVRTNHPYVANQRNFVANADFAAEFCTVAWRRELFQIDSRTDDLNFSRINSVFFH